MSFLFQLPNVSRMGGGVSIHEPFSLRTASIHIYGVSKNLQPGQSKGNADAITLPCLFLTDLLIVKVENV